MRRSLPFRYKELEEEKRHKELEAEKRAGSAKVSKRPRTRAARQEGDLL